MSDMIGKKVIVRSNSAGVHFGTLANRAGGEVTLINSRRLWYWRGAASLSQMAVDGVSAPRDCKFSVPVTEILVFGAIEIIPCTEKSIANIEAVHEWRA